MSLIPAPARRLDRALDSLWYLASAPQTLALLAALLAATLAFAAVIPQATPGLDPAEEERWLAPLLPRYGQFGPFLAAIGAFNVLEGVFVQVLLTALALNLALRLAAQVAFAVRMLRRTDLAVAPAGLPLTQATLAGPLPDIARHMEDFCRARYPSVQITERDSHVQLYTARRQAGVVGPALTYLGGLLLIAGLLVEALLGWREPAPVVLAPGGVATAGRNDTLQLTLDAIVDEPAAVSVLALAQGEARRTTRAGFAQPGRWGNLWIAQRATGPALAVAARDRNGRPLPIQSLAAQGEVGETLELLFSQTQNEEAFAIPTQGLTLRAVYYPALPEQGIRQPVYQVEAYREDEATPLVSALVHTESEMTTDGVTLTLRSDRYVELAVAYLPGAGLLALGGLLILLGALLSAYWGPVRMWVDLTTDRDGVRAVVRHAPPAFRLREAAELLHAAAQPASPVEAPHDL